MDNPFMARAIQLSIENVHSGRGGPFGAVIVKDGNIIAEGANQVTSTNDPTAHAEVLAIRAGLPETGRLRTEGCEIYTSCEPCPMCLGAIYWARLSRVYFANADADASRIGFDDSLIYREIAQPAFAAQDSDDSDDARRGAGGVSRLGREAEQDRLLRLRIENALSSQVRFVGERLIDRYFKLTENQTSVKQEMLGGLTTFVTMAYIVVVNPQILAQAGMPADGVVFATCLSAAVATLVMGLYANYPIALAPGMSLNAYFTYSVCMAMHVPWRTALAVVFFSGVLFLVLTVTRVREQIVNGMPDCLKHSTAAGIGMFIAFVGLRNAKLVVANPATFVGLGSFADKEVQTACFGLGLTLILMARKVHGAILIGIFGTASAGHSARDHAAGPPRSSRCRTLHPLSCSSIFAAPAISAYSKSCSRSCSWICSTTSALSSECASRAASSRTARSHASGGCWWRMRWAPFSAR